MSDGGVEGSKKKVDSIEVSKRASASEFGREIAKVAVAQICENVGFDSSNESALEALTNIMIRYVSDLGKTTGFYANIANRTECNMFDVVQGLEDLSCSTGFSGASEGTQFIADSGVVRDIAQFVGSVEETPFAQPVTHFPVMRNRKMTPSFTQIEEIPSSSHIPPWLPAFPDPHTYIHTPMWNERESDPREDKIALARQRRKAERSLLSLQQRIVTGGSELASSETNGNPFLTVPIQAGGERDVSSIPLPAGLSNGGIMGNHVSVLDTFSPAIEAARSDDTAKDFISDKRNDVYLSFKSSKKTLGEPVDLRIRRKVPKSLSRTVKSDERDDKKRRAELILKLSTENPKELTQL